MFAQCLVLAVLSTCQGGQCSLNFRHKAPVVAAEPAQEPQFQATCGQSGFLKKRHGLRGIFRFRRCR